MSDQQGEKNAAAQATQPQRASLRCKSAEHQVDAAELDKQSLLKERHDYTYKNDLLWTVGLLEWSNAMDFPANIFNQVPVPLYAQILMGVGGSIAILWSIFPMIDMLRSLRNIRLLLDERRLLSSWQSRPEEEDQLTTRLLVQSLLDVNFRELGWECIDRVLMDLCAGASGLLVGTGALMAIRGDIDSVFRASNLLSGYIGNSLLAPFALANVFWSAFMWKRASHERLALKKRKLELDSTLRSKLSRHSRKHKAYALLNGSTAAVGTVGSIMSSTLWYGYILIAPCAFTLLFCNLFWRHRLGYNRETASCKASLLRLGMELAIMVDDAAERAGESGNGVAISHTQWRQDLDESSPDSQQASENAVPRLDNAVCRDQDSTELKKSCERSGSTSRPEEIVVRSVWTKELHETSACSERFLIELYSRYLQHLEHSHDKRAVQDSGGERRESVVGQ